MNTCMYESFGRDVMSVHDNLKKLLRIFAFCIVTVM